MALLKCLEPVVSIGCALFSVPSTVGAVASGGIKIASLFHESGVKHGFDSTALMGKMQRAAFAAADRYDKNQDWRDALTEADAALTKFLPACVPTRPDIVECAREADFAEAVHRLLIDRIADKDARFQTLSSIGIFCPRSFASDIIRAVLEAALADEKYAQSLALPLQLETVRGVSDANVKLDRLLALVGGSTLPDQALRGAIARFVDFQPNASDADVLNAVAAFERDYRALLEQVSHISVHDNHIQSLKVAAEEALETGDIATARTRYAEAAKAATAKASEPVRNAAALKSAEASAALTMLDWHAADAAWEQAAAMLMPFDVAAGEAIVWEAANKLREFGETFANNIALVASEGRCRTLKVAAIKHGKHERVAEAQNLLGLVLLELGQRTSGAEGHAMLEEATITFQSLLPVFVLSDNSNEWAATQNNIGSVLRVRGQRVVGAPSLELLSASAAAYREALTVRTQEAKPADWAMTQYNLAIVLHTMGERTDGNAGLQMLADAVCAFLDALMVRTQNQMPTQWAMTQNGLGAALCVQGERIEGKAGVKLLADAVAAFHAALTIRTKAAMPAQWAMTSHNLGNALRYQGTRTNDEAGLALLADAAVAFDQALRVRTSVAMPVQWAMTQNGLGAVLHVQGERTAGSEGLALLARAVDAYQAALTIWTVEHFSHYHEMASNNLAQAEAAIAARRG